MFIKKDVQFKLAKINESLKAYFDEEFVDPEMLFKKNEKHLRSMYWNDGFYPSWKGSAALCKLILSKFIRGTKSYKNKSAISGQSTDKPCGSVPFDLKNMVVQANVHKVPVEILLDFTSEVTSVRETLLDKFPVVANAETSIMHIPRENNARKKSTRSSYISDIRFRFTDRA